ncbi:hypothetical protein AB0395_45785 [Streptosporangium sp. NPDC051023]|uniref:hypothetical protein n=1 Tax=Streptosporangium sp. NPDC051023 TaxID=3155410 RepID=UPI00344CA36C
MRVSSRRTVLPMGATRVMVTSRSAMTASKASRARTDPAEIPGKIAQFALPGP